MHIGGREQRLNAVRHTNQRQAAPSTYTGDMSVHEHAQTSGVDVRGIGEVQDQQGCRRRRDSFPKAEQCF